MKILITGGCGFVGTNLALFLNSKGFNINCLDNLSRKGSRYNLNLLKNKKIRNYNFDIYNFKKIKKLPKYDLIIDSSAIKYSAAPYWGFGREFCNHSAR